MKCDTATQTAPVVSTAGLIVCSTRDLYMIANSDDDAPNDKDLRLEIQIKHPVFGDVCTRAGHRRKVLARFILLARTGKGNA